MGKVERIIMPIQIQHPFRKNEQQDKEQSRKEYKRQWYQRNKQKVLAKEKDPARIQYKKEYYLKNKDRYQGIKNNESKS